MAKAANGSRQAGVAGAERPRPAKGERVLAGPGKGRNRGARSSGQDVVLFDDGLADPDGASFLVCCVDDTDDLSGETSTGYVAEGIAHVVASLGGRVTLGVSRHQLLLAEGVPYTSHNSAMCFTALLPEASFEPLREKAVEILARRCAPSADPGLCMALLPQSDADPRVNREIQRLVAFGRKAKEVVCTKEEAYAIAEETPWLVLSEHGGTGDGVIGALAGAGLRLSGTDGRFRGKWDLAQILGAPEGSALGIAAFRRELEKHVGGEVVVCGTDGGLVGDDGDIVLVKKAKPILFESKIGFVCEMRDGAAVPCEKADLGDIGNGEMWRQYCDAFEFDNDVEECSTELERTCRNCLYRRWTPRGFMCVAHHMRR